MTYWEDRTTFDRLEKLLGSKYAVCNRLADDARNYATSTQFRASFAEALAYVTTGIFPLDIGERMTTEEAEQHIIEETVDQMLCTVNDRIVVDNVKAIINYALKQKYLIYNCRDTNNYQEVRIKILCNMIVDRLQKVHNIRIKIGD